MTSPFSPGWLINFQVPLSGRVVPCDAVIRSVSEEEIETSPPERHKVKIPIKVAELEVQVVGDALYRATCQVASVEANRLKLRHPDTVERIQRRDVMRVPLNLPVRIAAPFEGQLLPYASASLQDLSASGCGVLYNLAVEEGARVTVTLGLPQVGAYVLTGLTKYCFPQFTLQGMRYRLGLEFDQLSEGDRQRLAWYVTEVHRKLVRKQTVEGADV